MVFLRCMGEDEIWTIFNDAIQFFGMHFSNLHQWSSEDVRYERGAYLRVYDTPVHAWNELFFLLWVSGCGRFIRADECTVDRARLNFARILILTTLLEVVNSTVEVVIDDCSYSFKLVEEWGCHLGDDAFLTEEEKDSRTEVLSQQMMIMF